MTAVILVELASEADFARALAEAKRQNIAVVDAYAPFLPEAGEDKADPGPMRVTIAIAVAGFAVAGCFYLFEWWSAAAAYPFNSGGRPPNSWPVFIMGPFEFGVFCAGLAGFLTFLVRCRLPLPHQPLFESQGARRISQDRYAIALERSEAAETLAEQLGGGVWRAEV